MFCTLKRSKEAGMTYSAKETGPPFAKPKGEYVAACTNCRKSKLKCSGETLGCQRCAAKKLQCGYLGLSEQHIDSATQEQLSPSQQNRTPDNSQDESQAVRSNNAAGTILSFDSTSPLEPADNGSFFSHAEYDAALWSTPNGCSLTHDSHLPPAVVATDDYNFDQFLLPSVLESAEDPRAPLLGHPSYCYSQALKAFEAVQVNLVWATDSHSGNAIGIEVLGHLKRITRDNMALLDCSQCTEGSAYVMMIVSMCSRMVEVLESISLGFKADGSDTTLEESGQLQNSDASRVLMPKLGNKTLDEDDEHIILKSLHHSRAMKVGELVTSVEKLVTSQNWPAHRDMMKIVREKLHKVESI